MTETSVLDGARRFCSFESPLPGVWKGRNQPWGCFCHVHFMPIKQALDSNARGRSILLERSEVPYRTVNLRLPGYRWVQIDAKGGCVRVSPGGSTSTSFSVTKMAVTIDRQTIQTRTSTTRRIGASGTPRLVEGGTASRQHGSTTLPGALVVDRTLAGSGSHQADTVVHATMH